MPDDDSGPDDESRMTNAREPSSDERRRAVCAVMGKGPTLVRFAARYTASIEDAEDVYQRAMEIALTKAPTVAPDEFLAWLYTVIRHEAFSVVHNRHREPVGKQEDIASTDSLAAEGSSPERAAEWRERYRGVRDAMDTLSDQQRTCVMLQSTGLSYEQIAHLTGFTRRQIERSISRGRRRLALWEDKLATGQACEQLRPALDRLVSGEASARERQRAEKHTAACAACRASLARARAMKHTLSGLVPVAVLMSVGHTAVSADPGATLDLGERVALSAAARLAHVFGPLGELPVIGIGRATAGTGAVILACLAAMPLLGNARPPDQPPPPAEPELAVTFGPEVPAQKQRLPTAPTAAVAPARTPAKRAKRPSPAVAKAPPARVTSPPPGSTSRRPAPPVPKHRVAPPLPRPPPSARAEFSP